MYRTSPHLGKQLLLFVNHGTFFTQIPMIYLELVARDKETLLSEAIGASNSGLISGINIPDVVRLSTRSYEGAEWLLDQGITTIPHIRASDLPLPKTLAMIGALVQKGLKAVLIISGDLDPTKQNVRVPVTALVSEVKNRFPNLLVYCGLDPYRSGFSEELAYCEQKLNAGADGFFTQPFFDGHLAKIYLDQLGLTTLFLGISPVTTEKSLHYWITKNKAIFPKSFSLDFFQNCSLAADLIRLAQSAHQNAYLMPIKLDSKELVTEIKNRL